MEEEVLCVLSADQVSGATLAFYLLVLDKQHNTSPAVKYRSVQKTRQHNLHKSCITFCLSVVHPDINPKLEAVLLVPTRQALPSTKWKVKNGTILVKERSNIL